MNKIIEKIYANIFLRYSKFFSRKNMNKFILNSINKHYKKDMKVISFGAGGSINTYIKSKGVKLIEIDIDKKRKPDLVLDITNLSKIKSKSIDLVFCMEVLEHVKNPFKAVSELKRVLKKGGIIIASTPFVFPIHDEPYDFFRYTRYGILELFKDFKLIELKERNSYLETIYVLFLRTMSIGNIKQRLIGVLLFPFFILALPFFLILNLFISNKQATTGYFYIFKKK